MSNTDEVIRRDRARETDRERKRVEAWEHAVEALKKAEQLAPSTPSQAEAWTRIACGWIYLSEQSREGLQDRP